MSKSIAIITGSTRQGRVGANVAAFVKEILDKETLVTPTGTPITLGTIDLASFKLPVYDEALIPGQVMATEEYAHNHSRAWSTAIRNHDGYVLVIPEYNYGIPGGLKNAIDYIYNEWKGKPVAIISYGIYGGNFSSEQAKQILCKMKLRVAETCPNLAFAGGLGPDLSAAMNGGKLGDDSRKLWTDEKMADIAKAFAEVKDLLDKGPEPNVQH